MKNACGTVQAKIGFMRTIPGYLLAIVAVLAPVVALGGGTAAARPKILGDAHFAIYEGDLAKARAFYEEFLGFAEPYSLKTPDGSRDQMAFIKINDYQYVELSADQPKGPDGALSHIAFYTNDAEAMRQYLAGQGIKVPEKVPVGRIGNANFMIKDPDGHSVEIVQYLPDSWAMRNKGEFMPDTRISDHMMHFGVTVANLADSTTFYHGILGFNEFWRGTRNPAYLSWVNMRVPEGQDYLELMLYKTYPNATQLGTMNHICLMVPSVEKAVETLKSRPYFATYGRELKIATGVNRKRQVNLYDPSGTRIELMEPNTIDGQPAPSSNAPPPVGERPGQ